MKKKKEIYNVCNDCGIEANRLTCLRDFGALPHKKKFDISIYHRGKCDVCGRFTGITETRDFFYPDFSLLPKNVKKELLDKIDLLIAKEIVIAHKEGQRTSRLTSLAVKINQL